MNYNEFEDQYSSSAIIYSNLEGVSFNSALEFLYTIYNKKENKEAFEELLVLWGCL